MLQTLLRYDARSTIDEEGRVRLAPNLERPRVDVRVRIRHPLPFRDGMLTLLACLASELYVTPDEIRARQLDPVVTATPEGLYFEVFSRDESTYARLVLRPDGLEGLGDSTTGCTNVDLSDALAGGLRQVRSFRPLWLEVTPGGVTVEQPDRVDREERVALPDTWVHGFLEVQAAARLPSHAMELHPGDLTNLLDDLKRRKARTSPRSLRFSLRPGTPPRVTVEPWGHVLVLSRSQAPPDFEGEVRVWGRRRLLLLAGLLPLARRVHVRLQGTGRASFWRVDLPGGSLTLGLSPWTAREWSDHEAALQLDTVVEASPDISTSVEALLGEHFSLDAGGLAARLGVPLAPVHAALDRLCLRGRVLYDEESEHFLARRLLDPEPDDLPGPGRRLEEARAFWRDGRVAVAGGPDGPWEGFVRGRTGRYAVRLQRAGGALAGSCACPFFQRYSSQRGPCKHLLAARMALEETSPQ